MQLLPLPPMHHWLLLIIFGIFCSIFVVLFLKKKRASYKPRLKTKEDIYDFSKRLQQLGSGEEINAVLEKLAPYKYAPKPPKIPKKLQKEALRLYEKYRKKSKKQFKIFPFDMRQ